MSTAKVLRWERRPDDRPQEILEAALQVFARDGYRNTTLDQVAEAAGVTKGAIYHYFDTTEALLLGVIEHSQKLAFSRAEIGSLFMAVLIGAMVCGDGQSNWYKGVQLITVYAIIALMFYLIPVLNT